MKDLTIILENRHGALADMGEALGRAGVSVEGGGAWVVGGQGVAIFCSRTEPRRAGHWKGLPSTSSRNGKCLFSD
jgi:hypothetical protein